MGKLEDALFSEMGLAGLLLFAIITALLWDRQRILGAHKDMMDKLFVVTEKNGDKYAQVVIDNTKVISEFAAAVREWRK